MAWTYLAATEESPWPWHHGSDLAPTVKSTHDGVGMSQDLYSTRRGENHCFSKLTDDDVRKIREIYGSGDRRRKRARKISKSKGVPKMGDIAEQFGVSKATLSQIVNGKIWKHVQ